MPKIYIVGIGPGSYEQMTIKAARTLELCDVIVGYHVYTDLVMPHYPDKEYLSTPMTKEADRCRMCFEEAMKGKTVAIICSGDAGVYGMAELMLGIGRDYPDVLLETVCGVTAAVSGAALLGAPLIQDFAVISLSDRLTPWEKIEKRIRAAAQADMVICLYNPSSRARHDYLQRACDLILGFTSGETVCGIAENIGRAGESCSLHTLRELRDIPVNMFSTVFIGNSQTCIINGKMVTPRGYRL
ncbi:MAG: precorrin-3B C(17)-methyltransferase [Lachnospiraceae bacterium]|nr:precorrin-3B C(17)-methyltransferase [Lachnospiraceae bacterium]